MKYLRPNIYTLLTSIIGLTNKVFYIKAPQEITVAGNKQKVVLPYVVFQQIDSIPDRDTGLKFKTIIFQISVFSKTPTECENISQLIQEKFEDNETGLNSAHYFCNRLDMEFVKDFQYEDIYQSVIQYKTQLTIG